MDTAPVITGINSDVLSRGDVMLSGEDRMRLADVVESSLRVVKRHQFYLWDQGPVQSLLPHDILICGVANGVEHGLQFHRFCITRYFRQEHFDTVCHPGNGLMARLIALWSKNGDPIMFSAETAANGDPVKAEGTRQKEKVESADAGLARLIADNELRNLAAHGMRDAEGRVVGYFSFSRVPCELGPRLAYLMELLVPIMHTTFTRVLFGERKPGAAAPRRRRPITRREIEILRWIKEGKTNNDIARILELSPWTVKNHVRAILKKLAVQNRSHAVARAISTGVLNACE